VLCDDAFKVMLACEPEQPLAVLLDVVAVQQSLAPVRHNRPQPQLAVDQRHMPQVLAIKPEQVEGVKPGFATSVVF
jgi:hypothetical protein